MNISPTESIIMDVLWETNEPLTSTIIFDRINTIYPDKWKYHTIVTFLSRLVKKKAVKYDVEGRNYLYYPIISSDEYYKDYYQDKVEKHIINPAAMFVAMSGKEVSVENIEEAKRMLEEFKKK